MAERHINIPIFIPHLGCPNACVFCNQRTISGVSRFEPSSVRDTIEAVLSTAGDSECEIAFFGGSFTGIDRELMISLLEIASEYIRNGRVTSVRCSTRPDYIDEEIISILEKYKVRTVELGLQSASDRVLSVCKRGHGFDAERRAVGMLLDRGFSVVGQMMIGLPGATLDDEIETARFIIDSGITAARIYPTVVFRDTELCEMTVAGEYTPLSLEDAIFRAGEVLKLLVGADVKIIRIGLCASENLSSSDTYFAGPNHPALGELIENELYYGQIKEKISRLNVKAKKIKVTVALGALSKAIGQRKKNRIRLLSDFPDTRIDFAESSELSGYRVEVEGEERNV